MTSLNTTVGPIVSLVWRFHHKLCLTVGTGLVYAGRAGATDHRRKGGASNYLCMPDDPDY
ncbi:hypothetical protein GBAR_LOCUS31552, partial [Geodia barretti]